MKCSSCGSKECCGADPINVAAPDMLEALKDVFNYFWNPDIERPVLREHEVSDAVEAAIAKAEGK